MKRFALILFLASLSTPTFAQEVSSLDRVEHLLDGTSFTFQYQNAGAIDASFAEGMMTYTWIAGRNAGEPSKTVAYKSKKLETGMYIVNWHEPDTKNFVTMVYNFNTNTCVVSVISKYGNEKPFTGFQAGVIQHFQKG